MEDWRSRLDGPDADAAWDLFIDGHRALLFATIRHYVRDHDEVMDVFAYVCEALRNDNMRRLRAWNPDGSRTARFSTWLVTVVQRLTVDWLRQRDGRRRAPLFVAALAPLQRQIFELVFMARRSHLEAFGVICTRQPPGPSYSHFLAELRATYNAVESKGRLHLIGDRLDPTPEVVEPADPNFDEQRETVERALATISAEDRAAVELFVVENLPAAEIARLLGMRNAKTVYNRVYRAMAAIRAWLTTNGFTGSDS